MQISISYSIFIEIVNIDAKAHDPLAHSLDHMTSFFDRGESLIDRVSDAVHLLHELLVGIDSRWANRECRGLLRILSCPGTTHQSTTSLEPKSLGMNNGEDDDDNNGNDDRRENAGFATLH